jgi:membrane-associated phospholipid phosphatase
MHGQEEVVRKPYVILACVVCAAIALPSACLADFAENVVDATKPAVAIGVAAAFLGGHNEQQSLANAARMTDAVVLSYGIAEALKPNLRVNDEPGFRHSFPSGHTTVAFATATSLAEVYPKQKWLFYAGAALVGWSVVETNGHTWADVAGGALLGTAIGKWSFSSRDGLVIGRVFRF